MTGARPQRVDGCARLSVARGRDGGSHIARLYQRAPCRMLFPAGAAGAPPTAVVLTTSGGITGGDRLELAVSAERDATVIATSQAAEKIYRSEGADGEIRIRLAAAAGASLEWLMQETILFDGARLRRRTEADVAPSARLLAVESLVFGRIASGERFARGRLHDSWRVRREGRLVWVDALLLDDPGEDRAAPFGLGDAAGTATILCVAPDVMARREAVRDEIGRAGVPGGASCFDGLMVVRLLASTAEALRAAVIAVTTVLRGEAMPRVWSC